MEEVPLSAAQRVARLIEELEISPYQFGKETGLSHQTISNVLTGKSNPSLATLEAIATRYPDTASWLLTGKGEMLRAGRSSVPAEAPSVVTPKVLHPPVASREGSIESLPLAPGSSLDAALIQEVKDSREKAWEQNDVLRAELAKAWELVLRNQERADHFQDLYLKKISYYLYDEPHEEQAAPSPEPAPPGKAHVDSYAAEVNPDTGHAYPSLPPRENGNVIPASAKKPKMRTDNYALLDNGSVLALATATVTEMPLAIDETMTEEEAAGYVRKSA